MTAFLLTVFISLGARAEIYEIAIIPRDTVHEYWESVRTGAEKAAHELRLQGDSINLIWAGSGKENDTAAQVEFMKQFTEHPVDGIILAPLDREELSVPVTDAIHRNIPVFSVDSGVDVSEPVHLVASDNYEAGQIAARELATLLNGRGNVILLRYHIHSANTEEREEGFLSVVQNEYPGINLLVTDYHAGPTRDVASRVSDLLVQEYHSRLNGIFASSECATFGALAALRASGLAGGKVKLVGFEDEGRSLREALREGDLQGLIVQDPVEMGYLAVKSLVNILRGKREPSVAYTGVQVLPGKNLTDGNLFFETNCVSEASCREKNSVDEIVLCGVSDRGEYVIPTLGLVMVSIPPGSFDRSGFSGSSKTNDHESLSGRVTFSRGFWLGKYEVTQFEWQTVMGTNPSDFKGELLPVDNVSWEDTMNFCRRLDERERTAGRLPEGYCYTLPSEAQWEYACRAGMMENCAGNLEDFAWFAGNSGSWSHPRGPLSRKDYDRWRMTSHPVGQKKPNAWGLFDMYGNVEEWCLDWYGSYPDESVTDPSGPAFGKYRVLRGGSWWTDPQNCSAANRFKAPPRRHHSALGFRIALARNHEHGVH